MKRILSSVLTAVLLFTTVISAAPIGADAAYSPSTTDATASLSPDEIKQLYTMDVPKEGEDGILGLYAYKFKSAKEMLDYEKSKGYISSITLGTYSLHVNAYTGYVYYENNVSGQILTSNPYDSGYLNKLPGAGDGNRITSQILIKFVKTADSTPDSYASSLWAGERDQISITAIKNGFRVNYTLGDTSTRSLLPVGIEASRFEETILKPILNTYRDTLKENDSSLSDEETDLLINETYAGEKVYTSSGYINQSALQLYLEETISFYRRGDAKYATLNEINIFLNAFIGGVSTYSLSDPVAVIEEFNQTLADGKKIAHDMAIRKLKNMFEDNPITGHWDGDPDDGGTPVAGLAIYSLGNPQLEADSQTAARNYSNIIQKYTTYTYSDLYTDEAEVGLKVGVTPKPVFRCSLEYVIKADGTLEVTLPASSISFDESLYTLEEIIPLEYFGCGVTTRGYESYAFFPDGSGMITDFTDHTNANHKRSLYGTDYAYSKLETSFEYLEQVTMPVFGVVAETASNEDPAKNVIGGYFAIVEDGSALAKLGMFSGGTTSKYANAYASYAPYPSDTFDLTETITVGDVTSYVLTLDSKYLGSFVTNITMLTDPDVAQAKSITDYYPADYVGMASRYRDYLIENGTLSKLDSKDRMMPLYIETLGTIEIIKKYLTFPVNVNIPLTSFDNVLTMYNELADAKNTLLKMADDNQKLADETPKDDPAQKEFYLNKAAEYKALANEIVNMTNVNFKLTGFANEGMRYTYPTRVKWERACGGKSGFRDLVSEADRITNDNAKLGIYPEFDFMFLMNEEMFDGVNRWDKSRMIDNRYASKQIYNPANRIYDKGFGSIISTASLSELFSKFEKKYSKYDWKYLSLSTFGSTLNSNFDEDNPINRDASLDYVTAVLDSATEKGYELMVDVGNSYTYAYASHIIDISIDSSHHAYCTYTVPFIGMVLHGYVNYTGGAINYSGSVDYDILRSIENGASLYYILCYQNTSYMKDERAVSDYYSVNYATWFERVAASYTKLNAAIGNLQEYEIVDHRTIIAEKSLTEEVINANVAEIQAEFIKLLDKEIFTATNAMLDSLLTSGASDKTLKISVDVSALVDQFVEVTRVPVAYAGADFTQMISDRVDYWRNYYGATDSGVNEVKVNALKNSDRITEIKDAFVATLEAELRAAIDAKIAELDATLPALGEGETRDYSLKLDISVSAIMEQLKASVTDAPAYYFDELYEARLGRAIAEIMIEYGIDNSGTNVVSLNALAGVETNSESLSYVSGYDYFTTSVATDEDYDTTFYSVTNYNVVMVTYRNSETGDEVSFVLNYNIDEVVVDLGGGNVKVLGKYAFDIV